MNNKSFKDMNGKEKILFISGWINNQRIQLAGWFGIFTFLGVIALVTNSTALTFYQAVLLLVVGVPILMFINYRFIYPATQSEQFRKSPPLVELKENVDENNKLLKELLSLLKEKL